MTYTYGIPVSYDNIYFLFFLCVFPPLFCTKKHNTYINVFSLFYTHTENYKNTKNKTNFHRNITLLQ